VLYWWNPICWWARHELREAEEQCCDAWVMWALPGSFKKYASALLEAVEFVSVRPSAPLLASGMGQFGDLRRRLTMLKQGEVARALTWSGLAAACGAGALLLSIAPTLAQSNESNEATPSEAAPIGVAPAPSNNKPDQPGENDQQKNNEATPIPAAAPLPALAPVPLRVGSAAPAAPSADPVPTPTPANALPVTVEQDDANEVADDDGDSNKDSNFRRDMQRQKADQQRQKADALRQQADQQRQLVESKRAQEQLDRARRDVAELSKRLAEASDRLKKLEMENAIAAKFPSNQFDIEMRDGRIGRSITVKPKGVPDGAQGQIWAGNGGGYAIVGGGGGGQSSSAFSQGGAGPKGGQSSSAFGQGSTKGRSSADDRERRLDAVERALSDLLKEVRQLRDEKDTAPRTPPSAAR
jgi:hypothetical protein